MNPKAKSCIRTTCKYLVYVLLSPLILIAIPVLLVLLFPIGLVKYTKQTFGGDDSDGGKACQLAVTVFCFLIGLTLDVIAIPIIIILSPYLLYLLF